MAWTIGTYKKEYENLKYQIEEYQDFWEWFENKYGQTKAELFDEFDLERALADSTGERQSNIPDVMKSVCLLCGHETDKLRDGVCDSCSTLRH